MVTCNSIPIGDHNALTQQCMCDTNGSILKVCTLECEGSLPSTTEFEKCQEALQMYPVGLLGTNYKSDLEAIRPDKIDKHAEISLNNLVKRYGGFIKKVDKNKIFSSSPARENSSLKGGLAKKYGTIFRKFGERDLQDVTQDTVQGDGSLENEELVYHDDTGALNEVKRYGGFLRKFRPKRSFDYEEDNSQEELQKRYGGFMRRVRPKLKWDNQKRYGGFLRRHFKISVRSDEEPSSYSDEVLEL
ncbi:PDYN protein, partial [Polypterus senegalus]